MGAMAPTKVSNVAHSSGAHIKSVIRREDTVLRYDVSGDNWHMSWAEDDCQYASLCDGFGPFKTPKGMYNSRLLALSGDPRQAKFEDVPGYPERMPPPVMNIPRYYNFGTLALDGRIYQFLTTPNHGTQRPDGSPWTDMRFIGAKLIYSPDNGRTWRNQNGSAPVVWEDWNNRSRETMVFFEEDQDAFSLLTMLQMGKNYQHNRDGYVYVYAPNGNTEGRMNELVMFRVPKAQILNRDAYEYFAGRRADGSAKWTPDITARAVVHTFPSGWVNRLLHPFAWHPSVVYNAPLGLYLMANWGAGSAPDGLWFGKPSYLGFWAAPNPWGPWTQIHEETAWLPAGDQNARAFAPQIAPKWIAADGKSFWLVWSDYQQVDKETVEKFWQESGEKQKRNQMTAYDWTQEAAMMRKHMPYYAFNVQRVDLIIA